MNLLAAYLFDGYQIVAIWLAGRLSNYSQTPKLCFYSLLKLFPMHPIVPPVSWFEIIASHQVRLHEVAHLFLDDLQLQYLLLGTGIAELMLLFFPGGCGFLKLCQVLGAAFGWLVLIGLVPELSRHVELPPPHCLKVVLLLFLLLPILADIYNQFELAGKHRAIVERIHAEQAVAKGS